MAAHARLKNEFTEDETCHNLMRRLILFFSRYHVDMRSASLVTKSAPIVCFMPGCDKGGSRYTRSLNKMIQSGKVCDVTGVLLMDRL